MDKIPNSVQCIDLFCGVGGLTHGFQKVGLNVKAGFDIDPATRHPFEQNNSASFFLQDVETISSEQIERIFNGSEIKVLAGF